MTGDILFTILIALLMIFPLAGFYSWVTDIKSVGFSLKKFMESNENELGASLLCLVFLQLGIIILWKIWQ